MKNLIYCLSIYATSYLLGCAPALPGNIVVYEDVSNSLRYSVDFENVGLKKINVLDMTLCKGQESSKARCGQLQPGPRFGMSYGSFYQVPDTENSLEWIDMESNELSHVKIKIQLPKLFNDVKYPSDIIFYINSSTNQVYVAYKVFSPEKDDFICVDSEGKILERYNVEFRNIGLKKIQVKDVTLCDSQESSKALCGVLLPGDVKNYGYFDKIPDPEKTLTWVDLESEATSRVNLKIQLPKHFYNAEYPSRIIFYINSSTDQVQVAYRIYSLEKDACIIVDSEGKPFELKKDNLISSQSSRTKK